MIYALENRCGLCPKGILKFPFSIEPNHSIKAASDLRKEKSNGFMCLIETVLELHNNNLFHVLIVFLLVAEGVL